MGTATSCLRPQPFPISLGEALLCLGHFRPLASQPLGFPASPRRAPKTALGGASPRSEIQGGGTASQALGLWEPGWRRRCHAPRQPAQFSLLKQTPNAIGKVYLTQTGPLMLFGVW